MGQPLELVPKEEIPKNRKKIVFRLKDLSVQISYRVKFQPLNDIRFYKSILFTRLGDEKKETRSVLSIDILKIQTGIFRFNGKLTRT